MKPKLLTALLSLMLLLNFIPEVFAAQNSKNEALFEATSPFEDLAEYAMAGDIKGINSSILTTIQVPRKIKTLISKDSLHALNRYIQRMNQAKMQGQLGLVALNSVEAYKTIIDELQVEQLKMPVQVFVLDYVGFKIHALLKQDTISWKNLNDIVLSGHQQWKSLRPLISDEVIKDTFDTIFKGLSTATKSKNLEMLWFAAEVDLDMVDSLEGYFQ